ncbi:hypothetical protein VTO42DRAFT_288 [Malbranchea cinnamomea]
MTRLAGHPPKLPDSGRFSPSGDRSAGYHVKLPADAPEVIAKHTIVVTDPARILSCSKDDRQRNFNLLVKRYKDQLLYGCKEPNCTTPTCWSCRKRVSDGPPRRFTDLSARTIACYLASQDNPERGLCCNEPVTDVDSLAQDPTGLTRKPSSHDGARKHPTRPTKDRHRRAETTNKLHMSGSQETNKVVPNSEAAQSVATPEEHTGPPETSSAPLKDAKRLKDPKSFTQNLFDTLALRMVEWLPLRRAPDGYDPSEKQPEDNPPDSRSRPQREIGKSIRHGLSESLPVSGQSTAQNDDTSKPKHAQSSSPPTSTTAVELKIPGSPIKRLSLGDLEPWRPPLRTLNEELPKTDRKPVRKFSTNNTPSTTASREPQSPPPWKHRPQKHKLLSSDVSQPQRIKEKRNRQVSWDSSKEPRQAQQRAADEQTVTPIESVRQSQWSPAHREARAVDSTNNRTDVHRIQSLGCLSKDIIDGLESLMFKNQEEREKWEDEMREADRRGFTDSRDWQYATPRQRQLFRFISQSVFYVFSNPAPLLESFRREPKGEGEVMTFDSALRLDTTQLEESFRKLYSLCPWETTLHSLWMSLEKLFILPKEFSSFGRHQRRPMRGSTQSEPGTPSMRPSRRNSMPVDEHVSDVDTAHIIVIVIFALACSIPRTDSHTWQIVRRIRSSGNVLPDNEIRKHSQAVAQLLVEMTDKFEHGLALRLLNRLARVVAARLAFHEMSKTRAAAIQDLAIQDKKPNVIDLVIRYLQEHLQTQVQRPSPQFDSSLMERPITMPIVTVEWLRNLLLKEWDGSPMLPASSAAGGALQMLASMYRDRMKLGLQPEDFYTPFLSERLDPLEMPVEWLNILPNNRTMHLLSYPFMFPPSALVIYFRALNYSTMSKSYESAMTMSRHVTQMAFSSTIPIEDDVSLLARLKTSISTYLVLVVRRDNVLTDALNQLWRREKRELMRPLKVQMGMDEGEEGIDHGGVQQEFFRVAMAEALNPSYGMFTLDSRTGMSWFQPCSMEPLYKFELLGLLLSLAVYNGLTVPVNFPVALYRKLLGLKVKTIEHISVGWPDLAKGLSDLLQWDDGDVGDIFMRTYEFSFEAFGTVVTVDMEKTSRNEPWPAPEKSISWDGTRRRSADRSSSKGKAREYDSHDGNVSMLQGGPDEYPYPHRERQLYGILKGSSSRQRAPSIPSSQQEAGLVTNDNREQFVKDYIFWLTDKSIRPQYEAFARGFYTCLDRTALSLFTPEALKTVIEGIQEIDMSELQRHTRYEGGFDPNHRVIKDFWDIVKRYPPEKRSQLLEFVTACDRVPVSGISSIMFVIQRNGVGDTRLPTSLTCFGRLLLPEYSCRSALEEKLDKALENAKGFGVA